MKWIVTLADEHGKTCTVEVYAKTKYDAEYRAAMQASSAADNPFDAVRVVVCRRTT